MRASLPRAATTTLLAAAMLVGAGAAAWAAPPGARPAAQPAGAPGDVPALVAPAAVDTGLAGDITFSRASGTFTGSVQVTLGTGVAGAQIRYTTNGEAPTASSPVYSAPLTLTRSTEVRAQAFVGGTATGEPGSAQYVATSVTTTHDLPVLVVDNYGTGAVGDDWRNAAFLSFEPTGGTTSLSAAPELVSRAGYHLRGQSSRMFAKLPYRIELRDNTDDDLDLPLQGMPAESDWVLRGPFSDKSLVREAFVLDLGRELGLQVPRYKLVEVYVNEDSQPVSSDDYRGVYLLLETIKNQKNRLDLKSLKPEDVTPPKVEGGYILKFEWQAAEGVTLPCTGSTSTCWRDLEVHDPDDLVPAQRDWIAGYVQKFHDSLRSSQPADPSTGYPAYIDVDSFVYQVIVNELSREMDSYIRSQYFYKDRGGKLVAGPLWDYDLSFGVGGYFGNEQTSGWQYQQTRTPVANDWFVRLMSDQAFANRVKVRWQELRRGALSDASLQARLDALTAPLGNAAARNFAKYPNLSTRMIGPFITSTTGTWQGQVQDLRTWLRSRAAWLDTTAAWGGPTTPLPTDEPTEEPTEDPTDDPTEDPTDEPTDDPTDDPTEEPTDEPTTSPAGCTASVNVPSRWPGGFQGDVVVTAGSRPVNGWTVTLTFPAGYGVSQVWNASTTTSGQTVTARNVSWNGSLAAGGTAMFGFIGSAPTSGGTGTPTATCSAS
ncbi:CotH kinase family protein [Cellulomonas palmilytica]|uniref:CotH kinase family protein n=1 Tax=Cellulomonas palmilytica TaxID=2608402 RepID=UPI001F26F8FE|nr:CotH kinase family protein [Cellulomonas palmilytica]UJP40070.1 CotH kinase family protein [Cellulomonas palmilytica]